MRGGALHRAGSIAPRDLDRQCIRLRRSIEITNFDEPDLRGSFFIRDGNFLDDAHAAQSSRLGAEPSAIAKVSRQNFALYPRALTVVQQHCHSRSRIEHRDRAFLGRCGCRRFFPQHKPVVRMRTERDDVRRFLDARKIILAENFHERAAAEAREIQLRRLRETRQIHHDEDRLILVPPKEREHFVVFGE